MSAHFDSHDRNRQEEAEPEAACHVGQFAAGLGCAGDKRFESHAADGTGAGRVATHLGVHRAGVDHTRRCPPGCGLVMRAMAGVMHRRVAMMIVAHAGGHHLPVEPSK
jgi:hypothetical protein